MKKLTALVAISTVLAAPSLWAACSADIDMGGNAITGLVDPDGSAGQNQYAATQAYADKNRDLMFSNDVGMNLSWDESVQFCEGLNGTARDNNNAEVAGVDYDDWRLPTIGEFYRVCLAHGSTITQTPNTTYNTTFTGAGYCDTVVAHWTISVGAEINQNMRIRPEDSVTSSAQHHYMQNVNAICVR